MRYRTLSLGASLIIFSVSSSAQLDVKKYKEEAEIIRKEIWDQEKPEFNVRNIPAEFVNKSKVIIAHYHEIVSESKKQTKLLEMGRGSYDELMLFETTRELIKVNDKVAVTEYSEIEYFQFEKERRYTVNNTTKVYVGVRIIKPDGRTIEVNQDDVVLINDKSNQKDVKLAIPDLQPGDIIDYFIARRQNISQGYYDNISSYTFSLFGDAPILHYSIHCELGKKYAIEYRCYNDAPDFKKNKGEDGENILDIVRENIPATSESNLWTIPFRQLPIIRMNIMVGFTGKLANRFNLREPGVVYTNQDVDEFIQDRKNKISNDKQYYGRIPLDMGILDDYYKKVIKNKSTMTPDSLLRELYYMHRFNQMLRVYEGATDFDFNARDFLSIADILNFRFGFVLTRSGIDNRIVLLTTDREPSVDKIMSSNDISYLITANANGNKMFSFDNMFSLPYEFPYYYENVKQAISLDLKRPTEFNPKNFEEGKIDIPGTTGDQNARIEKLTLFLTADGVSLHTSRTTTLRGHYKKDVQKKLVLFEDYHNAERKAFGLEPLVDEMSNNNKTAKLAEELKTSFAQAHIKQKDEFVTEAKDWFDQEITDIKNYKVDNMGVRHTSPDFIYSSEFNMSGVIKKAGNNLILEVGKLQGSPLKINTDQRKRTLDIYMHFARSLQTEIIFQIPDGYSIEGVSSLNKKVENETGHFITEATSDGKTVTIKISKAYNHAFEPAANWDKLLAFIDASNEWTNSKLLLKKKQ